MFVRVVKSFGNKYMQVVESLYVKGKSKHHVLWSLGLYDESLHQQVKQNISDWKKLNRASVVLKEFSVLTGPPQGKGYFRSFRNHY